MPPRPCYRIFRAAWIMARAFTPHLVLAPLALPWTLLSVIPGTLRRGLYQPPPPRPASEPRANHQR